MPAGTTSTGSGTEVPLPDHLEGTRLARVRRDPARSVKTAAFSQYPRGAAGKQLMGYTMRTERYRVTRWMHGNDHGKVDAVELCDHQADPRENVNIAGDPKHAGLVASRAPGRDRPTRSCPEKGPSADCARSATGHK